MESGFVTVTFKKISGGCVWLTVKDAGVGLPNGVEWPYQSPAVEAQSLPTKSEGCELDAPPGRPLRSGRGDRGSADQNLRATFDMNRALRGTIVTPACSSSHGPSPSRAVHVPGGWKPFDPARHRVFQKITTWLPNGP